MSEATAKEKGTYAFFSGLMLGWSSRLEELTKDEFGKHDVDTFKLIQDIKTESARLAKMAGLDRGYKSGLLGVYNE